MTAPPAKYPVTGNLPQPKKRKEHHLRCNYIVKFLVPIGIACLLLVTASGQESGPKAVQEPICSFDRDALLALDPLAFDQDRNAGWRVIARQEPCYEVAADLIRDYRETRGLKTDLLYWHEGQLRASIGQNEEAVELFQKAYRSEDSVEWNLYVDATIAFMRGDKTALSVAQEKVDQLSQAEDSPSRVPSNFGRLVVCFGKPYKEAMTSPSCRPR